MLSKEERHALAVRIRLGEIANAPRGTLWASGHPSLHWEVADSTNWTVCALGIEIGAYAQIGTDIFIWEDATAENIPSLTTQRVLDYLERDV